MTDRGFDGALDALTHETRVAILRTLADTDRPLPFSDLRTRVGVEDPGRFNYHLNELQEHFLRTTGDGYELNYRGERVLVAAGGVDTVEDDDACPVCGDEDCDRLIHVHLQGPV